MIVLIAIIAIILVRINNSNVSKKEDKDIKPVQRRLIQIPVHRLWMTALRTNQV